MELRSIVLFCNRQQPTEQLIVIVGKRSSIHFKLPSKVNTRWLSWSTAGAPGTRRAAPTPSRQIAPVSYQLSVTMKPRTQRLWLRFELRTNMGSHTKLHGP